MEKSFPELLQEGFTELAAELAKPPAIDPFEGDELNVRLDQVYVTPPNKRKFQNLGREYRIRVTTEHGTLILDEIERVCRIVRRHSEVSSVMEMITCEIQNTGIEIHLA